MPTELTWLGHGTWSIRAGGQTILLDPFLDDNPKSPVKAADARADFILVSHGHFDHTSDLVSIAKRTGATVIANFEICSWLGRQGVDRTVAMNTGGWTQHPFGDVQLTAAVHSSSFHDGSYAGIAGGFVLRTGDGTVYFACDTALFADMERIGAGGIDVAVLPIGDVFTMGPEDAIEATRLIGPKRVLPSHYNTWPPIEQDSHRWAEMTRSRTDAEPVVLEPGESISL
jgi:L-ascorbate metabolism protein UlaG (beta-lactamase superfamily)